jgi:hypothetical protein
MSEEVEMVTVDGQQFRRDALSQKAVYIISQMQEISDSINKLRRETDRLQMSSNAFSVLLKEEMQDVEGWVELAETEEVAEND